LFDGDYFKVDCLIDSGKQMTRYQVAEEIARRLARIFWRAVFEPRSPKT
jgi:hypothetical protein